MAALRWGVFVRDLRDGPEWYERFRWTDSDLVPVNSQQAALERAAEIAGWHPEWEIEARQTADPLPGTFQETFAEYLS